MAIHGTIRRLCGVALALALPSLACDYTVQPATRKAFVAAGLDIRDTVLVRADDGTLVDRRHLEFTTNRGALTTTTREREPVQAVRRLGSKRTTVDTGEIVLFSGLKQADDFLAAHGVDPDQLVLRAPDDGSTPVGSRWLAPPVLEGGGLTTGGSPAPLLGSGALADGGGSGGGLEGAGDVTTGDPASVARWVMNDGLAIHALPSFASAVAMEMERGDRVFVQPTAPVPADGNVFVQVQVADRAPYPVGWIPLHWLVATPVGDASTTIDFEASYGLVAHLARELVDDVFYSNCDLYWRYPQDAVEGWPPALEDPASIPYGQRYECGELPIGTVENAARKHVTTYEFDSPSAHYEIAHVPVVSIDSIHFEVPVKLYRLPWQTGETYEMKDLSTGWAAQFDENADVAEHTMYRKLENAPVVDDLVRVHDTDVWFNVSWQAPPGIAPVAGAQAYFNLCWQLPGGRLEGETSDLDVDIYTPGAHSHVSGVYWGTVDFSPFRVCATAALRATGDGITGPGDVLTNGEAAPVQVQLVKASIKNLSITYSHPLEVYGSFAGVHAAAIDYLVGFLTAIGQSHEATGLLFNAFAQARLEDALAGALYDMASRLASSLPDPEHEIQGACARLMPTSYRSPTSRFYPLWQQCQEAAQSADVTLFSNAVDHLQSCHDPATYARANDGSAWTSRADDHDVYHRSNLDAVGIDRPYWVNGCEVEATVETTVMSGYEDLLECAADVFDEGMNFRKSSSWIGSHAQERCLTPAVGLLCDLYGDSDDLEAMWSTALGVTPDLDGYTDFCAWYASLTAPDLPDYTIDPD